MSSLLEQASLVITPNAYKEGKLYGLKGTDLDVVRATTATRVNAEGLIEVVPYNLLLNSLAFAANYSYSQCSITSSQVAPDGSNNAKRITNGITATDSYFEQSISFTAGTYTWSIFVKQGTAASATIKPVHIGLGGDVSLMTFTFATETITSSGSISSTGFEKLSNGWYRIFCSVVIPSSVSSLRGRFGNPNVANVYNDWAFPQLVQGTQPKEYLRTETRLNIPRLDYSNGSCPSILVEPQRTNLALYSEEFETSIWLKSSSTISNNSIISPNGVQNADTFSSDGSTNFHILQQITSVSSGTTYSMSVFAKKNTNNFLQIFAGGLNFGTNVFANFDLNDGVVGAVGLSTSASIINIGNGWYKCTISGAAITTGTNPAMSLGIITSQNSVRAEVNSLNTSIYLWGAQLEAGSNATSYIPTVASAVSRNADVISKTGIADLIGQSEGTLFVDMKYLASITASGQWFRLFGVSNAIALALNGSNFIRVIINGVSDNITTAPKTDLGVKLAFAYNNSGVVLFVNGVQYALPNSGSQIITSLSSIEFNPTVNGAFQIGNLNSALLFKTRLDNETLATLTTL